MTYTTLIDTDTLARQLDNPDWILFDCRHDLARPEWGAEVYAVSHVPGAHFANLDRSLSGAKNGRNGRHPLPSPEAFGRWLGSMGVHRGTQVIGYDSTGGTYGSRLWWMLRWVGHSNVAVLDGGWDAWLKAGLPVTQSVPQPRPADFEVRLNSDAAVTADMVMANITSRQFCVVDARASDRFRGQNETIDPVAGHIPGAINRVFKSNLDASGKFKDALTLRKEWEALLAGRSPTQIVNQCGSGVTACHNALAMEIAGLTGSRLFPGSWSEWIADPSRPVAKD